MDHLDDDLMVGIDVGGTSMKGGLLDCRGHLIGDVESRPTKQTAGGTSEEVIENVVALATSLAQKGRKTSRKGVVGVGVAVPGVIDEVRGVALVALNVEWCGDPMVRTVGDRVGVPTFLGNDARVAGLAEGLWGAAAGHDDFLLIVLGTGVGAATVLRGEPYLRHGSSGGEFGHMSVNVEGADCVCGRKGCIEAYASGRSIGRRYTTRSNTSTPVRGKEVFELAAAGERLANAIWQEAICALATGIANYTALMDPEVVVVGGGVADAGNLLFEPLRRQVADQMPSFHQGPPPPIVPATFGRHAGIVGAAALAWMKQGLLHRGAGGDR